MAQKLGQLSLDPVRQPTDSPDAAIAGTAPAVEALREIIGGSALTSLVYGLPASRCLCMWQSTVEHGPFAQGGRNSMQSRGESWG